MPALVAIWRQDTRRHLQALKVDNDGADSAVTGPTDHSGSDRSAAAAGAALALRQVQLQASKMAEGHANRDIDGALCGQASIRTVHSSNGSVHDCTTAPILFC